MAAKNSRHHNHAAYRFFAASPAAQSARFDVDDFSESDIWGHSLEPLPDEPCKPAPSSRSVADKFSYNTKQNRAGVASTLPVSIPDWSKVFGRGHGSSAPHRDDYDDEEDDGVVSEPMVPPHEFLLSRSRGASTFSVQVDAGRTLKGRDLSRVRDAVWAQTDFQD